MKASDTDPLSSWPVNRPLNLPVYQSSAWEFSSLRQAERIAAGELSGVEYGTRRVPNVLELEQRVAELHAADGAVATNGGMAALMAVFYSLLTPGRRLLASHDLFGATAALLRWIARWGVEVRYVDATDLDAVRARLTSGCDLLLVETISNPCLRVPDLAALAKLARDAETRLAVDNTFATPLHCRPLSYGADLVIESLTKSLAGHNEVVLGAVAGDCEVLAPIRSFIGLTSIAPAPAMAALGVRGMTTFELRQSRSAENAAALASWLAEHPAVRTVHYPGLERHAQHTTARRQFVGGYGSIVSFEIGGERGDLETFFRSLQHVRLAMTLGGSSTLATHPWTMTHRWLPPEQRLAQGITEGLVRLSVGIEEVELLTRDLGHGLEKLAESQNPSLHTGRSEANAHGRPIRRQKGEAR